MTENPWDEPPAIQHALGVEVYPRAMVTGHRPQHLTPEEVAWSQVALHHTAWRLRSVYGMRVGTSGLAIGADQWWAMAVLACGAHLDVHIPFEDQPIKWRPEERALWAELRRKAKWVTVVGGQHYDVKMLHARNDSMLKVSDLVVALYKPGTAGGTASAVSKARAKGQRILLLNPAERTIRWGE